ncbi:uncharacterized protein A4U43_C06F6780 [Asparagus officinalis]|uniref:Uncharacterized protein n=1 Tax=Asparagus officinalis TaxID=4686 RepID=A0A5P1EKC3_ASPOF|nr:uncharacterized protein A4U43_C06F6780 [Asparagus officinalis]
MREDNSALERWKRVRDLKEWLGWEFGLESIPTLRNATHLLISIPPIAGIGDPFWKVSACDICEIATNLVYQSGFSHALKTCCLEDIECVVQAPEFLRGLQDVEGQLLCDLRSL